MLKDSLRSLQILCSHLETYKPPIHLRHTKNISTKHMLTIDYYFSLAVFLRRATTYTGKKGSNCAYTLTNAVNFSISLGIDPVRFLPDKSLATRVLLSSALIISHLNLDSYISCKQIKELNLHFRNSYARGSVITANPVPHYQIARIGNPFFDVKTPLDRAKSLNCSLRSTRLGIE
jgi:hypothetical protein